MNKLMTMCVTAVATAAIVVAGAPTADAKPKLIKSEMCTIKGTNALMSASLYHEVPYKPRVTIGVQDVHKLYLHSVRINGKAANYSWIKEPMKRFPGDKRVKPKTNVNVVDAVGKNTITVTWKDYRWLRNGENRTCTLKGF